MNKTNKGIENCPTVENPCMCDCHIDPTLLDGEECWNCRMGRHKPKILNTNQTKANKSSRK